MRTILSGDQRREALQQRSIENETGALMRPLGDGDGALRWLIAMGCSSAAGCWKNSIEFGKVSVFFGYERLKQF